MRDEMSSRFLAKFPSTGRSHSGIVAQFFRLRRKSLAVEETSTDSADSDASGSQTSAGTDKVIQKRRYSASEDELLIKLRTQSYPPPWKDLARQFDNRTVRCLTTRWDDFLKPRVQKVQQQKSKEVKATSGSGRKRFPVNNNKAQHNISKRSRISED